MRQFGFLQSWLLGDEGAIWVWLYFWLNINSSANRWLEDFRLFLTAIWLQLSVIWDVKVPAQFCWISNF